jgi:hypothetical protein
MIVPVYQGGDDNNGLSTEDQNYVKWFCASAG